jgi:hypothetical protein
MRSLGFSRTRATAGSLGRAIALLATLLLAAACASDDDPLPGTGGNGGTSSAEASSSADASASSTSSQSASSGGTCAPGSTQSCYEGPADTLDVGTCIAGTQTCTDDGLGFGPCTAQVLPVAEDCDAAGDEDCDGNGCGDTLWAIEEGDERYQTLTAVTADPASNVIAVGRFRGTLDLGNGVVADDSASSEPLFVAKLSPDGTASWLKKIDYTGFGYQAIYHVATDATGAIFLSGYFSDHLTIDAVTIEVATIGSDLFIAKLDANGQLLWLRRGGVDAFGDYQPQAAIDAMAVLPSDSDDDDGEGGDLVVTGTFCGLLSLGGTASALSAPCVGGPVTRQAFLARFDGATGEGKFAVDLGVAVNPFGLAASPVGDLVVSGAAESTGTPTTIQAPPVSAASNDSGATAFVARLTGDGTGLWMKTLGVEGAGSNIWGVAVDANDDIALVAEYDGPIDFGGVGLPDPPSDLAYWGVAKLHGDGTPIWAKSFTLTTSFGFGYLHRPHIAVDNHSAVLLGGHFEGSQVFDGQIMTSAGGFDYFVAKLETDGQALWSRRFGTFEEDFFSSLAVDPGANVLIGGTAWQPIDLGTGVLTHGGDSDITIAKIAP